MGENDPYGVGIVGCGAIGSFLARALSQRATGPFVAALWDRKEEKARELARSLPSPPLVLPPPEMAGICQLLVEAAGQEAALEVARVAAKAKKPAIILSVGAAITYPELLETGARLYFPSGALGGLDAVKAARMGRIESVTLTTHKPPKALEGAPYIVEKGIDLNAISEPTVIYEGPAREAVKYFPANVNVAAALSLAGVGPDKTLVRIIADPSLERNVHEIKVTGEFGTFEARTENLPCPDNPKTSMLAALSALALIEELSKEARVGT